jgi:hypothetical protein
LPNEQHIVNDKLLHTAPVALHSYTATTDQATRRAAMLINRVLNLEENQQVFT